jgi:phosphate transport system protein
VAVTRQHFHEELQRLENAALGGLDLVVEQLDRVTEALEHRDIELAQFVIVDDDRLDGRYLEVHQGVLSLLARQAPVAGDLRIVAALLHVIRCVERMGDQCVNVAKLIPVAGPTPPGADELRDCLLELGRGALQQVRSASAVLREPDQARMTQLAGGDAALNELNRTCFSRAIALGDEESRRAWATAMILVARAFERIGDNAVDIGAHLGFAATGTFEQPSASAEAA